MTRLGIALIGFAAALIGLYAATRLQSKLFVPDIALWTSIGLFFVSGLSLAVIGIVRNRGDITPRQRKRDRRLRVHFQDMQKVISAIMPTLAESYGQIAMISIHTIFGGVIQNITENSLQKFPDEFLAHFPKEANLWATYIPGIVTHNKKRAEFILKIISAFEMKGLKVKLSDKPYDSPYIYKEVFHPLFIWWLDRMDNAKMPQVDFLKIDVKVPTHGPYDLLVDGWCELIAHAENETDKEKCKLAIRAVANEYEPNAAELIDTAISLTKSVHTLKNHLADTIESVDKFWPGTAPYKFTWSKKCPKCKQIG